MIIRLLINIPLIMTTWTVIKETQWKWYDLIVKCKICTFFGSCDFLENFSSESNYISGASLIFSGAPDFTFGFARCQWYSGYYWLHYWYCIYRPWTSSIDYWFVWSMVFFLFFLQRCVPDGQTVLTSGDNYNYSLQILKLRHDHCWLHFWCGSLFWCVLSSICDHLVCDDKFLKHSL